MEKRPVLREQGQKTDTAFYTYSRCITKKVASAFGKIK